MFPCVFQPAKAKGMKCNGSYACNNGSVNDSQSIPVTRSYVGTDGQTWVFTGAALHHLYHRWLCCNLYLDNMERIHHAKVLSLWRSSGIHRTIVTYITVILSDLSTSCEIIMCFQPPERLVVYSLLIFSCLCVKSVTSLYSIASITGLLCVLCACVCPQGCSEPQSHPLSPGTKPLPPIAPAALPGVDFDSPAHFKPCLDSSAARHRMSIKPRNQRASTKGRRLPSVRSVHSAILQMLSSS